MGPSTGGKGSCLSLGYSPHNYRNVKVTEKQVYCELFMEKHEILKKSGSFRGMGPPEGPKCWGVLM